MLPMTLHLGSGRGVAKGHGGGGGAASAGGSIGKVIDVRGKSALQLSRTPEGSMRASSLDYLRSGGAARAAAPVSFDHYPDTGLVLSDGRHRITVAREQGKKQLTGIVRVFGPRGGLKSTRRVTIKI